MNLRRHAILLATVSIVAPGGSAQAPQGTPDLPRSETTAGMIEAADTGLRAEDAQLNKVYRKLMALIANAPQKEQLKAAQRAWVKFRDGNAEFEASFYEGGSIQPQIRIGCLRRMTVARTAELQAVLDSESGH